METVMEAQPSTHYIYPLLHQPPHPAPFSPRRNHYALIPTQVRGVRGGVIRQTALLQPARKSLHSSYTRHKTQDTRHNSIVEKAAKLQQTPSLKGEFASGKFSFSEESLSFQKKTRGEFAVCRKQKKTTHHSLSWCIPCVYVRYIWYLF